MHACLWRHQKYGTQDIKMPGMNHFVGKSVKMAKITGGKIYFLLHTKHSSKEKMSVQVFLPREASTELNKVSIRASMAALQEIRTDTQTKLRFPLVPIMHQIQTSLCG